MSSKKVGHQKLNSRPSIHKVDTIPLSHVIQDVWKLRFLLNQCDSTIILERYEYRFNCHFYFEVLQTKSDIDASTFLQNENYQKAMHFNVIFIDKLFRF